MDFSTENCDLDHRFVSLPEGTFVKRLPSGSCGYKNDKSLMTGNGLYDLSMGFWGLVYYCCARINLRGLNMDKLLVHIQKAMERPTML